MSIPIYQADSFTAEAFAGNPAGVCILPKAAGEKWMQNVAREMNLSETAFLVQQAYGYDLRWFTPAAEVDLCGHATLASAHILWETGRLPAGEQARFHTRSGPLTADRKGDWVEMDFPQKPIETAVVPEGLLPALGVQAVNIGKNVFDYMVEVESEEIARSVKPDFVRLKSLPARGVIVTSRSATPGFDFISRFFAPAVGINEDPVTGSAHCCLTPYWSGKLGKQEMTGYQASERGGVVKVRMDGERVKLSGQVVTVIRGEILPS
jgi:PhzF family phenazine biosynthesis protein